MTPTCVDLRERFGTLYRVRKEADGATWYETAESERVWLLEVPCRHGVVYPHGGEILAAVVTGRYARQQVADLACIRSRRGDAELVVTFHVDDAEAVFALLKPRRQRRVSPEQRERLKAMMRDPRFASRKRARREHESDAVAENVQGCVPGASDAGNSPQATVYGAGEEPTH